MYRQRFGIETSYRQMNQVRARTTSQNPAMRLLLAGLAFVIFNLYIASREQIAIGSKNPLKPISKSWLTLRRLAHMITRAIQNLFGLADLTAEERTKLERLFERSPNLKAAYIFRKDLTSIFETQLAKAEAKEAIRVWQDKVRQSALPCFDKFLPTLNNWLDKILDYFAGRFNSGFVEGLNNKIKTTKRRCYGILNTATLFQRLYLDLEGYRRFA